MVERFGDAEIQQLTDKNNTGAIDATILGNALADADATIDGYLAARYTMPLSSVRASIPKRAADLARYYLYGLQVPEKVQAAHDDAMAWLLQVSKGIIELGVDQPTLNAEVSSFSMSANPRVFSSNLLQDY
jgi:phage gp36-like protein